VNHILSDLNSAHEIRNEQKNSVGKTESKRLLGKPRRRWQDNIKIDLSVTTGENMCIGFILIKIGTSGGLL
jgi:hypothetical protein